MGLLSEKNLRAIIQGKAVGDKWPYADGSSQQIEEHLRSTVAELERSPYVALESEFGHYGSGYASYVDVFCYPKDGSSQNTSGDTLCIDGMTVYLGRLAPFAVLGWQQKAKDKTSRSYGFLDPEIIDTQPNGDWTEFVREIRTGITESGFTILDRETVSKSLPFESQIPTILGEPPYRVFDAVFFWED